MASSSARGASGEPTIGTALPTPPAVAPRRAGAQREAQGVGLASLALLPATLIYSVFVLLPLAGVIWLSLQQWDGLSPAISFVGLDNYANLLADPGVQLELQHSALWLVVTLTVPVGLGLGLALLLGQVPDRLAAFVRPLLLFSALLPTTVVAVAWRLFYNPLSGPLTTLLQALGLDNLAGDWLGDPNLALNALLVPACWAAFGLSMLVFGVTLSTISPDLYEAARIDGAGSWARFRAITLPGLRGALPLAMVVTAFCAVPSVDLVRLLTNGGPGYATTIVPLDMYGQAFNNSQVGVGAALACLQGLVGIALTGVALIVVRGGERLTGDGTTGRVERPRLTVARLLASLLLLAITALILFPLIWLVVLALQPVDGASLVSTLSGALTTVWGNGFGAAAVASLQVALAVSVGTVVLSVPAAFALFRARWRLLQIGGLLLLTIGLFQPTAVLIIPLYTILNDLHLLNSQVALVVPQIARALPVAIGLLWLALRGLPSDILDAAALDARAVYQVLRHIAIPLTLPMIAVSAVWAFLTSWNDYLLPIVVVQDDTLQTLPLALAHFIGRVDTQYGLLATGALLTIVPIVALYAGVYSIVVVVARRRRLV